MSDLLRRLVAAGPAARQIAPPDELQRSSPRADTPDRAARVGTGTGLQRARSRPARAPTRRAGSRTRADSRVCRWCRRGWPARRARGSPRRRPRRARHRPRSRRGHTGRPGWPPRAPAARRHRRGAAPWCADRARTPWRPTRPAAGPARRRRRHERWPQSKAIPTLAAGSIVQTAGVLDHGGHPHPGGIDLGHPQVDPVGQFGLGQLHPLLGVAGDRRIQFGDDVVFDVVGAGDDRRAPSESRSSRGRTPWPPPAAARTRRARSGSGPLPGRG